MRQIVCPTCSTARRPYGLPRDATGRYEICTGKINCSKCGSILFVRMDYVLELAPVDIAEAHLADGTPCELLDKVRGAGGFKKTKTNLEVDADDQT